MHDILLVLGILEIMALAMTGILGLVAEGAGVHWHLVHWHLFAGVAAGFFTIAVQALIFVYFLGTGKSVRIAVQEHGADLEYHQLTRQFKFDCYPISMLTALLVITTVFAGGGALTAVLSPRIHSLLALTTFLTTAYALRIQLDRVARNQRLLEALKSDLGEVPEPADRSPVPDEGPSRDRQNATNWIFIGVMCWLPWLYLRHIVRLTWIESWWFGVFSVLAVLIGIYRHLTLPSADRIPSA